MCIYKTIYIQGFFEKKNNFFKIRVPGKTLFSLKYLYAFQNTCFVKYCNPLSF